MLGVSAAQVFLDEEERLFEVAQTSDITSLPSAVQTRVTALRSNVQRLIDVFRQVDSRHCPIFSECISLLMKRRPSRLTNNEFAIPSLLPQTRKRRRSNECENEGDGPVVPRHCRGLS